MWSKWVPVIERNDKKQWQFMGKGWETLLEGVHTVGDRGPENGAEKKDAH